MARPVILTVDDDVSVSQAVARDLRNRYAERYRIVRATSGAEALATLDELGRRDQPVALILSDHRMPEMTGIEFLERARADRPRRQAGAAHRLRRHRRGDQGDQRDRPRPLPDEAVGTARGAAVPRARRPARCMGQRERAAIRRRARGRQPLVGAQLRDADVPRPQPRAVPVARARARPRGRSAARAVRRRRRPSSRSCCCPTATCCTGPSTLELADALGLHTTTESTLYDVVIVGAGPAGLAAAVYARVGGTAHDRDRARRPRRAGRPERADRELPRLPERAQRFRSVASSNHAGAAPRRRDGARPQRPGARAARARSTRCASTTAPRSRRER